GREALGEVRAAVTGYRARGLDAELAGARVALDAAGIDAEVHADPTDLRPEQESALAMAVREAVTNVVRHADAQRATISITTVDTRVRLEVTDDGRGTSGQEGSGLTGMRERIAVLGGHVDVRQAGGGPEGRAERRGTVVEVTLPLVGTANGERHAEQVGGR
ncbi:MAG: ATP-binding protein, partial [Actinomycetota bacterium]|nr:ATP-binding protein [Actinomycetota bacterium]